LFENASAEIYENVGLLAYSPMGFVVLSGKFLTGESHPKTEFVPQYSRYKAMNNQKNRNYTMKLQLKWFDLNRIVLAFIEQQHF
jgi:aryl-alcohol dehydrogenase-like predicted oxidoreductase